MLVQDRFCRGELHVRPPRKAAQKSYFVITIDSSYGNKGKSLCSTVGRGERYAHACQFTLCSPGHDRQSLCETLEHLTLPYRLERYAKSTQIRAIKLRSNTKEFPCPECP